MIAGAMALVATGCSGGYFAANRVPVGSDVVTDRRAGNLGTRVCVINASSQRVWVGWNTFDSADEEGDLPRREDSCAEGTKTIGEDVIGKIQRGGSGQSYQVVGSNKWAGAPRLDLLSPQDRRCVAAEGFDDGETRTYDSGNLVYEVTRDPDSGWKELRITLRDSTTPTRDGADRACRFGWQLQYP